ncbi:hypothetical protein PH210_05345 [Paenibacillus sp. BSR1-1]|uniref:hypothetical protein n=1 Tax=Paenibacillus sp. BSR1-1 TaxID=3020845 RepID=UPI0025B1CAF1|nr:hypothetical protein [Paenibacillus sp. BSR1-1]MDN3015633.1 hypothetical protein [Paenibacillus sp. BSR1-1]
MAIFRTGPFLIPNFTLGTHPINIIIVTLSNLTNRTLNVRAMIKQSSTSSDPVDSPVSFSPLLPAKDISLPPNTVSRMAVPLSVTNPTESNTTQPNSQRILSVIVSGDIRKSGDLVQVTVAGGSSSDGYSLDISEPTLFFRHSDFVEVHHYHPFPFYHPLDPKNVENN